MSIAHLVRQTLICGVACILTAAGAVSAPAIQTTSDQATAVLQADRSIGSINPAVYGQFAEHLGRGIYEGIWVGTQSPIPNTHGFRNDVIDALRHIKVPVIRWPGGCFAEDYNWRDGIGPRAERPVRVNSSWGDIDEPNTFGTHEYMEFSELVGAKTYVTAPVGAGTPLALEQWLEYMTSDSHSTLAEERRKNGRTKPFHVDYLGIGNEAWGCGGQMTASQYAAEFRRFVTFARVPPNQNLLTVAVGPSDDNYHWTEVMMRETYNQPTSNFYGGLEALSLHYYTLPNSTWEHKGAAIGFPETEWIGALSHALRLDEYITKHTAIMDRYDPAKKVALVVDEWGTWYDPEEGSNPSHLYQQNSLRDALTAAVTFNIFHRHADRVRMANIAQMVNVLQAIILTDKEKMLLTPISCVRHVSSLSGRHLPAPADRLAALPCRRTVNSRHQRLRRQGRRREGPRQPREPRSPPRHKPPRGAKGLGCDSGQGNAAYGRHHGCTQYFRGTEPRTPGSVYGRDTRLRIVARERAGHVHPHAGVEMSTCFAMSTRRFTLARLGILLAAALGVAAHAAPVRVAPVPVSIDARATALPVTRYEYGMFIEPIGALIARSLWAEMLDDRKFYYPIVPQARDAPVPPSVEGRPGILYRKWRPIGGDDVVAMDQTDPYTGSQSVRIAMDEHAPRGFVQRGIGIAKGRRYTGHIVLDADTAVAVRVALNWGPQATEGESILLPGGAPGWRSVPFEFTAGADTTDASFEVTATGTGNLRVGVVSLMPADNIDGWRADSTSLLRSLHSGMWRLPGGNFLSNWDWHGALGPRDRRAPMFDHAWSAMQPNDLGMDEYLELTRLLDVEPYVTVNAGLGDANSAAEEVAYLNGPEHSEWGAKRAADGHPAPYGVRFWNIGNEPYGWWQIGKTSLDYFMMKHIEFANAMRSVDPSITLIGSGAMPDQLHPKDAKENASLASIQHKFGTEEDWTGGLFTQSMGYFDGISEHWYDRAEERSDAPADEELIEFARSPSNQVRMKAEEWHIYEQRFPAIKDKHIFLSIDEFAYLRTGANLKSALAYSMVLQEMLRHTNFITMSAFTTGASTLDVTPTSAVLNSTGEVFKLYGEHFGAGTVPLAVSGDSPQPAPRFPVGFDHPTVRAGSPTYPLDVIAGLSADRKTLRIGVVNATFQAQTIAVSLEGLRMYGRGTEWRLTGPGLDAANVVGKSPAVTIEQRRVTASSHVAVAPLSTSIYEFPVTATR
jgi:alpha-N-arabinofuranosidase